MCRSWWITFLKHYHLISIIMTYLNYLVLLYTAVYIIYKSVNFPMSTLPSLGDISDFNERNGTFNILHLVHNFQTFIVQSQNNVLPGHWGVLYFVSIVKSRKHCMPLILCEIHNITFEVSHFIAVLWYIILKHIHNLCRPVGQVYSFLVCFRKPTRQKCL